MTSWKGYDVNMENSSNAEHAATPLAESDAKGSRPAKQRNIMKVSRTAILLLVLGGIGYIAIPWLQARWTHVLLDDARIAANMIAVSSEVSGKVALLPVIAGDTVKRGQVLATIDTSTVKQELRGLEAQVDGVKSQQSQLRAQQSFIKGQIASKLVASNAQIEASIASHAAAEVALANAQSQFDRTQSLVGKAIVSDQQFEDARAVLLGARQQERLTAAGMETAKANLDVVKAEGAQIAVLEQQISTLDAQLELLAAQTEQKRIELGKREIKAEFDGVVDSTFIDPGEYVSPGTRLLIYHDPRKVWVDANVKETDFSRLAAGAPARITVDAFPGQDVVGKVVRLGEATTSQFALLPSPNPSGNFTKVTQRLPIRVSIDQGGGQLRPGMMVEVSIDVVH